jgi:hypothetical protein
LLHRRISRFVFLGKDRFANGTFNPGLDLSAIGANKYAIAFDTGSITLIDEVEKV